MLIEPPIDQLVEKIGCRYALVCVAAKRARELCDTRGAELEEKKLKPVSVAAMEIYQGKISAEEG